ncbi:hypothetical protein BP5796_05686 [Coleophoma crateriformis]|uniref:Major facilitator superfamily (MFS) profile domain-containing protein n=1 Tax=Coleophoma crateriformis TaxID=565419 RepID=A0A3D8S400_9HELO|nr:hypothetical protein BP5796_05686 [Coleophoma crateriformis]
MTKVPAAGYAVITLVFLYNAAYAFSWLYLVVAYPVEIAPYKWRARMWALTLSSIFISAFFNQYVNIAIEIAIIWKFFPETSGRTLEEIAVIFDGEAAAITNTVEDKATRARFRKSNRLVIPRNN